VCTVRDSTWLRGASNAEWFSSVVEVHKLVSFTPFLTVNYSHFRKVFHVDERIEINVQWARWVIFKRPFIIYKVYHLIKIKA